MALLLKPFHFPVCLLSPPLPYLLVCLFYFHPLNLLQQPHIMHASGRSLIGQMLFEMFRASSEALLLLLLLLLLQPCSVILVGKYDSCHNSTLSLANRNKLSNV